MEVEPDEDALLELAALLRAGVVPLGRAMRGAETSLTPTQLSVLGAIHRYQPISMGALAEKERLSRAVVSRVVTSLVDHGLVERMPEERDRRVCRVQVSEAGDRWIEASRVRCNAWLAERLSRLDASQRQTIAAAVPLLESLAGDDGRG
ncbi:MAG: MarR family transcriptional regulator [Acidimicrobiales bacterium]|nr:MarR family transcriptional regulator [Acidimicrobiales bacterium]